ncbi:hypothetical protein TNCV_1875221 [Trichonephila clavipes]|nr:hypothetical protein TNCV_1875221 [Trichonephila clavipes]
MASDRCWPCHEFEPSTPKDLPCRGAMHVKSVESSNVLPLNPPGVEEESSIGAVPGGGVGTSESERCHSHENQAQDALDRPVVEQTATSMASWAPHEFERIRGKVTANMERNTSRHHTELVCHNDRSYRIVHSR